MISRCRDPGHEPIRISWNVSQGFASPTNCKPKNSSSRLHLEGQASRMVILRDSPFNSALFGLVSYSDCLPFLPQSWFSEKWETPIGFIALCLFFWACLGPKGLNKNPDQDLPQNPDDGRKSRTGIMKNEKSP